MACALDCGPMTPVATNCTFGYRLPNEARKGIEPPSPVKPGARPKASLEATSSASASQGARGGEYQPLPISQFFNVTRAEDGTSVVKMGMRAPCTLSASTLGGRRKDSFAVVEGRRTLPAISGTGAPPRPTIESVAYHVRRRIRSSALAPISSTPSSVGSSRPMMSPNSAASADAARTSTSGIFALSCGTSTSPVVASSTRSSSSRRIRKDDGTTPLADPLC